MAKKRVRPIPRLTLGRQGGLGQLHVGIEAFFEFSFWLAEELEDLVGYWSTKLPRSVERRALQLPTNVEEDGPWSDGS